MTLRNNISLRAAATCAKAILCLVTFALVVAANAATDRAFSLGDRPLSFESNVGQYGRTARFVSRGPAYYLSLSPTEVNVTLRKVEKVTLEETHLPRAINTATTRVDYRSLRIELLGANSVAMMSGVGEVSGRVNYFIGNDASQWRTGVPAFDRVRVTDVYPGINLIHYGNQNRLEYDFEIAPGVSPDVIALKFTGADKILVDADGDLILSLGNEEIRQPKPVIYQTVRGARKLIEGGYVLADANTVKFTLGDFDRALPLVIDPVVSYVVYQGGNDDDVFWAVATDTLGNVFIAGETVSTLATTNPVATGGAFQTNLAGVLAGHGDVLVQKLPNFNTESFKPTYSTYLGGAAYEAAFGLAVDVEGNAYVAGYTGSTNFPTQNPLQTNIAGVVRAGIGAPPLDCFIAKIGPFGTNLIFSTFFGGAKDDVGLGLSLDATTNIYVAGYTLSTNFPVVNFTSVTNIVGTNVVVDTNGPAGGEDAFVIKLAASGTNVIYSRYIGGAGRDYATDVITGSSGEPVLVGYTTSSLFPTTTNAVQPLFNGTTNGSFAYDAFIVQLASSGTAINYAGYVGGSADDAVYGVTVDAGGNSYFIGNVGGNSAAERDGFVLKILADDPTLAISPAGTNVQLSWSGFSTEFTLESRTNLASTNTWAALTDFPASLTNNRTVVTIPATNDASFFRLKK